MTRGNHRSIVDMTESVRYHQGDAGTHEKKNNPGFMANSDDIGFGVFISIANPVKGKNHQIEDGEWTC